MSQIKIKQVEGLQSILDALTAGVTSGSVKSVYTQANHGFTPGIAVTYTTSGWIAASQDSEDALGRLVVESVPTSGTFVGVSLGTITVPTWNLTPGIYYVVDDIGGGHMSEFTNNDAYNYSNPLMQAITSTTAHVLPWRPSAGKGTAVQLSIAQTDGAYAIPTNGNYSSIGLTLSQTPYRDGSVSVYVNGIAVQESYGSRTGEVYFSNNGGLNARAIADLTAGDTLYWNGDIAGFDLTASDYIEIQYQAGIIPQ
jgi:hypothetical protein